MASTADRFIRSFKDAISSSRDLTPDDRRRVTAELDRAIAEEPPPCIAIIGEAGVGKSTTLNALFNAGAPVGHSRATTKSADMFHVEVSDHRGNKGNIRVLDVPGLGESIARSRELKALYLEHLPHADVILWVHPLADRMLEFTQRQTKAIFSGELAHLFGRLVFGLNKADEIHPRNWRTHGNVPSEEQMKNLEDAERNFGSLLSAVSPKRAPVRVVTYSAEMRYNLPRLFRLLMDGMSPERRWVLERRMDIADFLEKADPRFVAGLTGINPPQNPSAELPNRDKILALMTADDLRECLSRGLSPEDWWRMRGTA